MNPLQGLRAECLALAEAAGDPQRLPDIRAAYLTLVTLLGQVSGQIGEVSRLQPQNDAVREATMALERAKRAARQVGLDIRLASPSALAYGIHAAALGAVQALDMVIAREEPGP